MKKTCVILLSVVLILALAAGCGGGDTSTPAPASTGNPSVPVSDPAEQTEAGVPGAVDDTVYTLTVSTPKNENADAAFIAWLHDLEEKSGGRLQFDIYTSSSLYQQSEVISAMAAGMCDICDLSLSEDASTFELNCNIISLPFMGMNFDNDWIYQTLYEEYDALRAEYEKAGVVLIDYSYNPPFNFHFTSSSPITEPSDLKGLKVVTTSDILSKFISEQGGAPVSQPITEWYNSLEKGVASGLVAHANNIYNFSIIELLKQDVIFGEGSGITTNLNAYLWAEDSWNSLPEDLQQLVLDTVSDFHAANNTAQEAQIAMSDAACVENGNLITVLTGEQIAVWRDAAKEILNEKLAEIEADTGAPMTEMYNRALELASGD